MEGEVAKTIEWWQSATVRPELDSGTYNVGAAQMSLIGVLDRASGPSNNRLSFPRSKSN
jgi:hypothetical protein